MKPYIQQMVQEITEDDKEARRTFFLISQLDGRI
jgi:hypothetical protein